MSQSRRIRWPGGLSTYMVQVDAVITKAIQNTTIMNTPLHLTLLWTCDLRAYCATSDR